MDSTDETEQVDVSFLLTVYNKAWALPRTLESLQAQHGDLALEFVFIDDGSTDGSVDFLTSQAETDTRIRVLTPPGNEGPAVRVNQAAEAARGKFLIPIDADDLAPPNVAQWMFEKLEAHDVPLIYGRRRASPTALPVPEDAEVIRVDTPLRFAAERKIVHMALMVERALYLAAGGADPSLFVQDQSLPLRLAKAAPSMLWTDATLCWELPAEAETVSSNSAQLNHDRFFTMLNMLSDMPESHEAFPALRQQAVSAAWKLRRDRGGAAPLSMDFLRYVLTRNGLLTPDLDTLREIGARLNRLEGVRRPSGDTGKIGA